MQTRNEDPLDTCNYPPQLDSQFIRLLNVTLGSEHRPIDACYSRFEDLRPRLDDYRTNLEAIFEGELREFNDLVRAKEGSPVIVLPQS